MRILQHLSWSTDGVRWGYRDRSSHFVLPQNVLEIHFCIKYNSKIESEAIGKEMNGFKDLRVPNIFVSLSSIDCRTSGLMTLRQWVDQERLCNVKTYTMILAGLPSNCMWLKNMKRSRIIIWRTAEVILQARALKLFHLSISPSIDNKNWGSAISTSLMMATMFEGR